MEFRLRLAFYLFDDGLGFGKLTYPYELNGSISRSDDSSIVELEEIRFET